MFINWIKSFFKNNEEDKFICENCLKQKNTEQKGYENPSLCYECIDYYDKREYLLTFGDLDN